jgi:hypothetical protein
MKWITCETCEKVFQAKGKGRPPKTCSYECRRKRKTGRVLRNPTSLDMPPSTIAGIEARAIRKAAACRGVDDYTGEEKDDETGSDGYALTDHRKAWQKQEKGWRKAAQAPSHPDHLTAAGPWALSEAPAWVGRTPTASWHAKGSEEPWCCVDGPCRTGLHAETHEEGPSENVA